MNFTETKYAEGEIRTMIANCVDDERIPKKIKIITDTTDFFRVDYDNVLVLDNVPYFIRNYEREGRFSIDEQPKFWVRRAINLITGEREIIKMVFHEKFRARVGELEFMCIRSAAKEARILNLVKNHPNFMQGFSVSDSAGNILRVISYIPGISLQSLISGYTVSHEEYFHNIFPIFLDDFIELVEAIEFLHIHGEKHGDIRRDHIIKDKTTGTFRWIDFDFNYWHRENIYGYDLFGLGNVLIYLSGKGDITCYDLQRENSPVLSRLSSDDMNIIFGNRVVNLKKIYQYMPDALNMILLHFSAGANTFYDETAQFLNDLYEIKAVLHRE